MSEPQSQLVNQPTATTIEPKLAASGTAGAASIVLVYIAEQAGLDLDAVTAAAFVTVASFVTGYIKRTRARRG